MGRRLELELSSRLVLEQGNDGISDAIAVRLWTCVAAACLKPSYSTYGGSQRILVTVLVPGLVMSWDPNL